MRPILSAVVGAMLLVGGCAPKPLPQPFTTIIIKDNGNAPPECKQPPNDPPTLPPKAHDGDDAARAHLTLKNAYKDLASEKRTCAAWHNKSK